MKTNTETTPPTIDARVERAVDDVAEDQHIHNEAADHDDDPVLRLVLRSTIKSGVPLFVDDLAILDQIAGLVAA